MNRQIVGKQKLWLYFLVYSLGNLLIYSAFGSLLGLQSSLNIVDNVGKYTYSLHAINLIS